MADPADKLSAFQPFSDIVGGQRDEGYINLSGQLGTKIDKPASSKADNILVFNASTGKYEASTLSAVLNPLLSGMLGYQRAVQSADVTITATSVATANALTGATLTIPTGGGGLYRVTGYFDIDWTVASTGTIGVGVLYLNGSSSGMSAPVLTCLATATRATVGMSWYITLVAGDVVDLRGLKTAAAGTLIMRGLSSSVSTGVIDIIRVSF